MRFRLDKRAQSTLEYALLIGVIVAGLIAMQMYLKRGYQGKLRESTDQIGEQYSPDYTTSKTTITKESTTQETVKDKVTRTEFVEPEKTTQTSEEKIDKVDKESF
jgi:Flp pilus assembly pilin Flp